MAGKDFTISAIDKTEKYCAMVKAEHARYMYKPGTVAYGGL